MAIVKAKRRLAGAHIPHHKNTEQMETQQCPIPERVVIPMLQHMGAPCDPLVKKGDPVLVGQKIGDSSQAFSVPIHASCSGTVAEITEYRNVLGVSCKAVVLDTDGGQKIDPSVCPPDVHDRESFLAAVRESGLVGLGGAGFPAHIKLGYKDIDRVDKLVINAAECEPYITADYRACLEDTHAIADGVRAVCQYLDIHEVYIGIENNKPLAMEKLDEAFSDEDHVTVVSLKSLYPQGAEKSIIYATCGIVLPRGKLPADCGVLVMNVSSVAHIGRYLKTGMPLVSKRLTVDGDAVLHPANLMVPIGTPIRALLDFCGVPEDSYDKVLMGGPMMGTAVESVDLPVVKNNNAILAFKEKSAQLPVTTACIRCGKCIGICPMKLMPARLEKAYDTRNPELLQKLSVDLCISCGCCSFICPAKRHLAQKNQLGKVLLKEYQSKGAQKK